VAVAHDDEATKTGFVKFDHYERARRAGQVTYYELGKEKPPA
jgi:hypothetical protein